MERINLKSQGVQIEASKIDAENGILYDVVMCQEGPAKGHGVELESVFIEEVVAYANKKMKGGVKSRFDHPSMCGSVMGSQAGYFKDVRLREVEISQGQGKARKKVMQAIGNLHLLNAANESPTHPNMKNWILKMAAESPEFIMNSIVFTPGNNYQRNADGSKHIIEYTSDWYESTSNIDEKLGAIYVEFIALHYTDLVEAGAATDALFSAQFNTQSYAVQAVEWLNDNPSIKKFITEHPDKVQEFLDTCGIAISKPTQNFSKTMDFLKKIFGTEDPAAIQAKLELANAELTRQSEALTQKDNEIAELKKAKEDSDAALNEAKTAHETALAEANATIEKLSKEPNGTHSGGQSELEVGDSKEDKMPAWSALKAEIDAMM